MVSEKASSYLFEESTNTFVYECSTRSSYSNNMKFLIQKICSLVNYKFRTVCTIYSCSQSNLSSLSREIFS